MTNIDGLPAECADCGEWICECLRGALLDDMARAYRDHFEGFLKSVPIGWTITTDATDATVDLDTNTVTITCTARPPQPADNG